VLLARSRVDVTVRHCEEDNDRHHQDVEICGLDCELPNVRICSTSGSWDQPTAFGNGIQCNATRDGVVQRIDQVCRRKLSAANEKVGGLDLRDIFLLTREQ
jgi:hypothetical protein